MVAERKRPGDDSLSSMNTAAEVDERDYKEGQRRKAGQMSSDKTSMAESDEDMG